MAKIQTVWQLAIVGSLIVCQSGHALSAKAQRIYQALQQSNLTQMQKIQHMANRLGYGTNVESFRAAWLTKRNGQPLSESESNEVIAQRVENMLDRRYKTNPAIRANLQRSFPTLTWTRGMIHRAMKSRREPFAEYRDLLEARREKGIEPTQAQQDHLVSLNRALNALNNEIRLAEQADQLAHAVGDESPFFWVLLDFWFNHFNTSIEKNTIDMASYRNAIGAHMFGKFSDLVLATARHPQMLIYLDNNVNRVDRYGDGRVDENLNENYGREIMELHTLGRGPSEVSNGWHYDQKDVVESARIFTGWGFEGTNEGRIFRFWPSVHASGTRTVMGRRFPEGEQGGREFIRFLANHPFTIQNLAKKLTRVFVVEDLSTPIGKAMHDRIVDVLSDPDAELQDAYLEIVASPQFWSRAAFRTKVKTPLHFIASAMRATGYTAQTISRKSLEIGLNAMGRMGQKLLWYSFPTGYPIMSSFWGGSSVAIAGVKFGFEIAGLYGPGGSSVNNYYLDSEQFVRGYFYWPQEMGTQARIRFKNLMDFAGYGERYGMPASIIGDGYQDAFNHAARVPDRVHGAEWYQPSRLFPIRSLIGVMLGSADFMKH